MSDRIASHDFEAGEMMDEIISEAADPMSPTVTPFVSLGTADPAAELLDGPTTEAQAEAHDLWQALSKK